MLRIKLHRSRLVRALGAILAVLVFLHLMVAFCHMVLHIRVGALTQLVDMDMESNLPTFFNALLFFIAAALFHVHGRSSARSERWGWFLMVALFIFLGFDEGSQIHEKFGSFTMRLLSRSDMDQGTLAWLRNGWIIPYAAAVVALVLTLGRWFLRLEPLLRRGLLISGAVYVAGAIGFEMAGSKVGWTCTPQDSSLFPWMPCELYNDPSSCWLFMEPAYLFACTMEETLEMTGLILCIHFLMRQFERKGQQLVLSLEEERPEQGSRQ